MAEIERLPISLQTQHVDLIEMAWRGDFAELRRWERFPQGKQRAPLLVLAPVSPGVVRQGPLSRP